VTDNADGVSIPGIVAPDLGRDASTGFQSSVRAYQAPYSRPKHRIKTMDGGEFATIKRDDERSPFVGNLRPTNETND
jgi:hypothetical protein